MKSKGKPAAALVLRLLGRMLIRGPESADIRADLDELYGRDIERGVRRTRAQWRYARNMLPSAVATWRAPRMSQSFIPSALDFRLGLRMLAKYPGLTIVGGLAIAFAICVGAAAFEVLTQGLQPSLPLPGGDRIVGIRQWDAASGDVEPRVLDDLDRWRSNLRSVEDLGAFRTLEQNLVAGGAVGPPVAVAELSASAFRVAGVNPLLGRPLIEADERPDAAPVIVIGYDIWQGRFGGARDAVGASVTVDGENMTVVGVMPEGFAFPIAHSIWRPLRPAMHAVGPREGPAVHVFGRLASGVTLERAQSELAVLGEAAAAEHPETHEHLRPQVMEYARSVLNVSLGVSGELDLAAIALLVRTTANIPLILFLVLVCGNVALLIFARAATREREIVLRNALGASRSRIIVQLFAEALVLGTIAMLLGLAAADFTLRWGVGALQGALLDVRLPFWFEPALSSSTILYAAGMTLLVAVIAGVLPALKVTRGLGQRLQRASAGAGGFRFGGVWTAVIVAQIAVTVPFPVTVLAVRYEASALRAIELDFPEEQYLAVRFGYDRQAAGAGIDTSRAAAAARLQTNLQELERRLVAEPGIVDVTFANRLPRMYHPYRLVEMDGGGAAPLHPQWPAYRVSTARVAPDFFDVLQVPILAGRRFHADETSEDAVVVVNEAFVRRVLGGRNAIGRRVRFTAFDESGPLPKDVIQPWHEIVGVVPDLGMSYGSWDPKESGIYHPAAPGSARLMAVHISGSAAAVTSSLREAAAAVDPALRVYEPSPITEFTQTELRFYDFWEWFLMAASGIALVLALAGIYSVMSFTVAQRTREIGIRVTLGANPRRVVSAIFRRPLRQVAAGIALGTLILLVPIMAEGDFLTVRVALLLLGYIVAMTAIFMLAWVVPTLRALSVEPTEALRWE